MKLVNHLGVHGQGRTLTEARKHAEANIASLFERGYGPRVYRVRGATVVVWPVLGDAVDGRESWGYSIIRDDDNLGGKHGSTIMCAEKYEDVLIAIAAHLAQNQWNAAADAVEDFWSQLELMWSFARRSLGERAKQTVRNLEHWDAFQGRYAAHIRAGMTPEAAYKAAAEGREQAETPA